MDAAMMGLVAAEKPDDFDELVELCIDTFRITYSDATSLDANGVIGKLRAMILDDVRYKKETKRLLAKRRISELQEVNDLIGEVSDTDDYDEEEEEEPQPVVLDEDEGEIIVEYEEPPEIEYDARMSDDERKKLEANRERVIEKRKKEAAKKAADLQRDRDKRNKEREKEEAKRKKEKEEAKPKKLFDKTKIELRMKLLQQRRDIFKEETESEDKEGDALNVFFFSVSREEFEKLKTVEVSVGTSVASAAFKDDDESEAAKLLNARKKENSEVRLDGGTVFHYEQVDGEEFVVED